MHRVAALKADTILSFSALRSNKPMCPPVLALKWLQIGVSVKGVGGGEKVSRTDSLKRL